MHSNDERITLVYHGNCAFTHQLKPKKPLTQFALWKGELEYAKIECTFKFSDDRTSFEGSGRLLHDDSKFEIKGELEESENEKKSIKWKGEFMDVYSTPLEFTETSREDGKIKGKGTDGSNKEFVINGFLNENDKTFKFKKICKNEQNS